MIDRPATMSTGRDGTASVRTMPDVHLDDPSLTDVAAQESEKLRIKSERMELLARAREALARSYKSLAKANETLANRP